MRKTYDGSQNSDEDNAAIADYLSKSWKERKCIGTKKIDHKIKVACVLERCSVPPALLSVKEFDDEKSAVAFINEEGKKWWDEGVDLAGKCGGVWEGEFNEISSLMESAVQEANGAEEHLAFAIDTQSLEDKKCYIDGFYYLWGDKSQEYELIA
jgi:hypothetical protein